ncbi:MAG TPA: exodeoxyribonuclease VII large subunit [Steroidobacteraceae bacterium]|jgi:exodeoxyribonuclease VII large subunit
MSPDLFSDLAAPAPVSAVPERDVYTPSRLNREARILLERGFSALWIEGEISNLSRPSSGHWYFSIKDESAQLRCAMFRQRNLLAKFTPKDGMLVQLRGRVSVYEPRGDYQFLVDHIEEAGEGALRRRFELLKAKLAAEGLFSTERKQALPKLPRRIGVITSPTGAAIRDVLNILRRRFCTIPVLIYPVPVQGAAAAAQIAAAIRLACARAECDVLILARGGGSLEDLWSFNEEIVARAIAECTIPLVSGVGHEVDFTIADFVADVRAPTPSGAAELVVPDCNEWLRSISVLGRRLAQALQRGQAARMQRFVWLQRRLAQVHPGVELRQRAQRLDETEQRLIRTMRQQLRDRHIAITQYSARLRHESPALKLAAARGRLNLARAAIAVALRKRLESERSGLALAAGKLDAFSPLATLQRGYAIVTDASGRVVTDAARLPAGELFHARVARGRIEARVVNTFSTDKSEDKAE